MGKNYVNTFVETVFHNMSQLDVSSKRMSRNENDSISGEIKSLLIESQRYEDVRETLIRRGNSMGLCQGTTGRSGLF